MPSTSTLVDSIYTRRVSAGECYPPDLVKSPLYLALGDGRDERTASYRDLFRSQMESALVDEIRVATNGNYVLGSRRFQDQVESMLKRRVRPGKAGRPRKCGYKLGSVPNLTEGERQ